MRALTSLRRSLLALCFCTVAVPGWAEAPPHEDYKPVSNQDGKDVVWVPTPDALVEKMLDIAKVAPEDYVIDLGSGDGRIVIAAAQRGARALGIEFNPDLVRLATRNAARAGVGERASFVKNDLFARDYSKASVVTMFLMPELNLRLRPTLLALRPGTRIVSNTFTMGDWQPDEIATAGDEYYRTVLLWVVPADVAGRWWHEYGELRLEQRFQRVTGVIEMPKGANSISGVQLRGAVLTFRAGDAQIFARVSDDAMAGTLITDGQSSLWRATRVR